jgi:glycosyltransferase involved in cell wall biosynthesis
MTVDIVCATYNGAPFLAEFRASLEAQTHSDWRLWLRDDGSRDDTVALVQAWAAADLRVHLTLVADERDRLGAARSFAWLLERLPRDRSYVMFADQDDVWRSRKIELTLGAMRAAESNTSGSLPVLVHTDLTVTDSSLTVLHRSFWEYANLHPEQPTLRRTIAHNVTTGSTVMMNRALADLVGAPPPEIAMHDWWCASVAAAFGKIVAVHDATVLYRQHDANAVGARDRRLPISEIPRAIVARRGTSAEFRHGLSQAAAQAESFLKRYGEALSAEDRRFIEGFARLPQRGFVRRKIDLLRYRVLPDRGVLHALGVLLRG